MRISIKLFLSLLALTSVILLATLSLARWSFERGFLDFISGQESERLQYVADDLIDDYLQQNQSWTYISEQGLESYLSRNFKGPRPRNGGAPPPRMPPPSDKANNFPPPHSPNYRAKDSGPPTGLFDAQGQWLSGSNNPQNQRNNISLPLYVEGVLIGELRSWPNNRLNTPLATAFSRDQLWTSLLIGLVCLCLASLMSWLLARVLLKPLKLVLGGVSQLSKGDYSLQFAHSRQDELGQLLDDVQNLSITLDKNRTAKNRWLADISHELRTPLSILCGEIDALKAGIRPFDQHQLQSLEQETHRLTHLVNDLYELSLSDIGGLRYQFTATNLNDCLAQALNSLANKIAKKTLELQVNSEQELWLNADPRRLEQLFINLLNNAIAYTDVPGQIVIAIYARAAHIIINIQDSAPSVAAAECELLFEPLYRQDSARNSRHNGAGLGLSICKNIVEAHQGKIMAKPSTLGGIEIQIQLPIKSEVL